MQHSILPFPQELRPRLPTIVGNVDYLTLEQRLHQIDSILKSSGIESSYVALSLERWLAKESLQPSANQQLKFQQRSQRALRCNILRTLLQEDYRGFSCQLAGCALYQWFCAIDAIDRVRVPSKSELQRFSEEMTSDSMRVIGNQLLRAAIDKADSLELKEALNLDECFIDSTCLKADIHFPVDWVLLRDGVRTLMKAARLIRREGLCARMEPPEEFLRRMNRLCIEMTHRQRSPEGPKQRKQVLRKMKRLVGVVRGHAKRHRALLDEQWEQTEWTRRQAEVVLARIDTVLKLLPQAQKQAHERIIGERQVPNDEKILSLYDTAVRVIVRGKAGAEVEFGNSVSLAENPQGIFLDYKLYKESAPADSQTLFPCLTQIWEATGTKPGVVVTDRGYASAANSRNLKETETYDATCPRQPAELALKMKDPKFARLQRRRAQTEARIAILKNGFLGRPMRAKGFAHRELGLAWGVLTHNLWMLARLRKPKKEKMPARLRKAA